MMLGVHVVKPNFVSGQEPRKNTVSCIIMNNEEKEIWEEFDEEDNLFEWVIVRKNG